MSARPAADGRHDAFRPEVQGLRAVAVGLVVLFHLWPRGLTGGYVGVDVFFVISGYLITSHLLREVLETGSLRVTRFWARRIRRLLPASLLVLALSAAAVVLWAPSTSWTASGRQVAASALYVQNWALALDSVDYMARDNVPTVAQHYWSLSVEEQFYAVWPLLIVGLLAFARRRHGSHDVSDLVVRRHVALGLGAIALVSLAWSAVATAHDQAFAYLSTFTRAWEFAAGALAATVVVRRTRWTGPVLAWAGLAAVVAAGVGYTDRSAFPGWIALLPVLGTVAVLLAAPHGVASPARLLSLRPMTFLGDISYSVYLVHWPLIVLVPFLTGHVLRWPDKLVVVWLTVLLAWLSKTRVEDPLRTGHALSAAPWRPYAFAVTGMACLVMVDLALTSELEHRQAVAAARTAVQLARPATKTVGGISCLGPGALAHRAHCRSVAGSGRLLAPPDVVSAQSALALFKRCQQGLDTDTLLTCDVGDTSHPTKTVALVGDSHAGHWVPMMDELGKRLHWDVVVHTKASCPATDARRVLHNETNHSWQTGCEAWNHAVDRAILADPRITDVFVSSNSSAYTWTSIPGTRLAHPAVDGFQSEWRRWIAAGKDVHVLADVPRMSGDPVPGCIAVHASSPVACSVPRRAGLPDDVMLDAARTMRDAHVSVVDLSDEFCDALRCYAQIGGVIVFRDRTHLSVEYSRLLAPYVIAQL